MNPVLIQNGIDPLAVTEGSAFLLVGILALLLWAIIAFQNPAGIALWAFTVVVVALSVLFPVPIELVWIGVLFTAILTIIGVTANVVS
jgi:hypothetical protein